MRPRKEKPDNRKRKINTDKLLRKSRNRLYYLGNVNRKEGSDIEETFNNIIRDHKSQAKVVKHWKLSPKDSCEVYKDRRKRKIEDDTESKENNGNTEDNVNKTKPIKKRVKRRPLKRDSRGRFLPETSSTNCSCSKCAESIYSDDQ
ncbi:uncharacterized protein LOC111001817 [Pieris rapae]|uniref:uncharacterized protein LOC111001817 n=1 Tax=Pieris rapae TaxID=64459 RepID=UPI000B9260AC|nr:uncharacterized protein LOC111001817 [Pieris rapae]